MKSFSREERLELGDFETAVQDIYLSLMGNLVPESRLENVETMGTLLELLRGWVRAFVRMANESESEPGRRISEDEADFLYGTAAIAFGTALALHQEPEVFIETARPDIKDFSYMPLFRATEERPPLH